MRPRTRVALAVTLVLWASAFAGIRVALRGYGGAELALLRYVVASAALAFVAAVRRTPLPKAADLPAIAVVGLFGFAAYNVLLNRGEQSVPAGTAALLISTAPIFTALLATLFLRERLGLRGWVGIAISFAGATCIVVGQGRAIALSEGAVLVLGAAVTGAVYIVLQKPLLRRYPPMDMATYAIWAGTLFLLVFSPRAVRAARTASWQADLAVVYLGLFPAALGYVTWTIVLSHLPASRAATFLYLMPVIALLIARVTLGETPTLLTLAGGALALSGVAIVNFARSKPATVIEPVEAQPASS